MSQLQFELVSPAKLLASKPAGMVTVPGGEGDYGVLAGHAPMITTVRAGVIGVYANANDTAPDELIFVSGGFAEVTPERCTVLADEAIPVAELNRVSLETASRELSEKLASATDSERAALENQQKIIAAKLQVAA